MKYLFVIMLFFTGFKANAQSDFAPIGAKWYYNYGDGSEPIYGPYYYNVYEAVGDTQVGGEQMRMIVGRWWSTPRGRLYPIDTICVSATPDTVFYFHRYLQKKVPLLVFNVQAGDTITFYDPNYGNPFQGWITDSTWHSVVDSITNFTLNGRILRKVHTHEVYNSSSCCTFLGRGYAEMMGSFDNFMHQSFYRIPEDPSGLRCYVDTQLTYHQDSSIFAWRRDTSTACDAHPPILAVSNVSSDAWLISPNPTSDFLHITGISVQTFSYSLSSINGQQQRSGRAQTPAVIDVEALPRGLYFLQIKTEGNAFTQKVIISP